MSNATKEAPDLGHVDQIREIIVGDQFRQVDTRLEELESLFADRLRGFEERLEKGYASRERAMTKEVAKLAQKLETEKAARLEAHEAVTAAVAALEQSRVDRAVLADLLEGLTVKLRGNGRS
ncbi:MAG: hypothetical protein OEN56_11075 [Gemmatimonadota bacterium]|nr:hypothetical protein [Gemmatimonadota bacterium]